MNYNMEITGYGIKIQNPITEKDIKKITEHLDFFRNNSGGFDIEITPRPLTGPQSMKIECDIVDEKIEYFITLLDSKDDTGYNIEVRTSLNMRNSIEEVEFFGNLWSRRMLVDFDYMQKVVFEFVTTGDVSRELLDS
jgi:hypothetical protein